MKCGNVSAIAVALCLGLVTAAEAEDWAESYVTVGVSSTALDLRLSNGSGPADAAVATDISPYLALGRDWNVENLTFGVLADIDGMSAEQDYVIGGKNHFGDADLFATLRGRVGVPVHDSLRLFASAGLAWMETSVKREPALDRDGGVQMGGVVGLGLDYALTPRHRVTLEYVHADFGAEQLFSGDILQNPTVDALRLGLTLRF